MDSYNSHQSPVGRIVNVLLCLVTTSPRFQTCFNHFIPRLGQGCVLVQSRVSAVSYKLKSKSTYSYVALSPFFSRLEQIEVPAVSNHARLMLCFGRSTSRLVKNRIPMLSCVPPFRFTPGTQGCVFLQAWCSRFVSRIVLFFT